MRAHAASFPKAARLLKTDEFSSVFRLRPWARSAHFVLYGRRTGEAARLGLVVGKKYAPRAVTRNVVRRLAREAFRVRRLELAGWDILVRLHLKFDRKALPSASSAALKQICRDELNGLLAGAAQQSARRSAPSTQHAGHRGRDTGYRQHRRHAGRRRRGRGACFAGLMPMHPANPAPRPT
jgi:ribonuclease P protein component